MLSVSEQLSNGGSGRAGVTSVFRPASPTCPTLFRPQQNPFVSNEAPQAYPMPAVTSLKVRPDEMGTGAPCGEENLEPLPTSPYPFDPQQYTVPSSREAQVSPSPAAMELKCRPPLTGTGVTLPAADPFPRNPVPQQKASPDTVSAHVCWCPALMPTHLSLTRIVSANSIKLKPWPASTVTVTWAGPRECAVAIAWS